MNHSRQYGTFRALLRKVREEANLTQTQLADKLRKPQTFVSKSELGERRIDFLETLEFCRACGISAASFIERLNANATNAGKGSQKRKSPRKMNSEGEVL